MTARSTAVPTRPRTRPPGLWELFGLWRASRTDPDNRFSRVVSATIVDRIEARHGPLAGQAVVDVGTGDGTYATVLADRGARVVAAEYEMDYLLRSGTPPPGAVVADGRCLPLADGSVDGVVSCNVLEHTPEPYAVLHDIARVLKPGGWAVVNWTNWYSPWGGHAMTPYQYLGPRLGPRVYERRHGPPPTNRMGEGLFALHIAPVLARLAVHPTLTVVAVEPRYWPTHRWIMALPGLREVAAWNCALWMVKRARPDMETARSTSLTADLRPAVGSARRSAQEPPG